MTILITGMYRSGSTWMYNIVRLMCEEVMGDGDVYSCFIADYDQAKADKTHIQIIKLHEYDKEWSAKADVILFSERDKEGIIASFKRMWDGSVCEETPAHQQPDFIERMMFDAFRWGHLANWKCEFAELRNNKLGVACGIANQLGILTGKFKLNPNMLTFEQILKIVRQVENIQPPTEGKATDYDKLTLLHPKHRSDRFEI